MTADLELRRDLKCKRTRMYKIAFLFGLASAVPVYLLKDSAPWAIAIPICIGALVNIVLDWRKSPKKAVVGYAVKQSFMVQVSQSFYTVHRPSVLVASSSIDRSVERERFAAQAREADSRLVACHP